MDDATLTKLRTLIEKRDKIDKELDELVTGKGTRTLKCSICNSDQHTARTCDKKPVAA